MSTNILLQNDISTSPKRRYSETTTRIQDLNADCLREIFLYLDLASQFAVLKASQSFLQIILYDIWYQYYDVEFDINKDHSIKQRSLDSQYEFLQIVLKNFAKIKGLRCELFKTCVEKISEANKFEHITSLTLANHTIKDVDDTDFLDMKEFLKFPNLQELNLENVKISWNKTTNLDRLKTLTLTSYKIECDISGNFLKNIFSKNLEKLVIKPFGKNFVTFTYDNFLHISECANLKELTLCTYHINDPRFLNSILTLPNLEVFTLKSYDCYYFTVRDHSLFYEIIKLLNGSPKKTLDAFEINGIPQRFFFQHLEGVPSISWRVDKMFSLNSEGVVEWKSDIVEVIGSFYKFITESEDLRILFLGDNMFHKKGLIIDSEMVLQMKRWQKGLDKLKIINDVNEDNCARYFNNISDGSVRFVLKNRICLC